MGRYFGIANSTTNEHVSSYWKGDSWCDCYQVMHQLHWEKTDEIYSASHSDMYEFTYDKKTKSMIASEIDIHQNKKECEGNDEENSNESDELHPAKYYGLADVLVSTQFYAMLNHVPNWDGNICRTCKYNYDDSKLKKYEKKFNGVYFMG